MRQRFASLMALKPEDMVDASLQGVTVEVVHAILADTCVSLAKEMLKQESTLRDQRAETQWRVLSEDASMSMAWVDWPTVCSAIAFVSILARGRPWRMLRKGWPLPG